MNSPYSSILLSSSILQGRVENTTYYYCSIKPWEYLYTDGFYDLS